MKPIDQIANETTSKILELTGCHNQSSAIASLLGLVIGDTAIRAARTAIDSCCEDDDAVCQLLSQSTGTPVDRGDIVTAAKNATKEIEFLRRWKEEAHVVLAQWESIWEALGQPGQIGSSKAAEAKKEVERLRARVAEWERRNQEGDSEE